MFEWPPTLLKIFNVLTSKAFWARWGVMMLGAFLLIGGIVMLVGPSAAGGTVKLVAGAIDGA